MTVGNLLLLTQSAGYAASTVLSLCVMIPLIVNVKDFKGNCPLYTTGEFLETGDFVAKWASCAYCLYTGALSAVLVIVSLTQLIRMTILIKKGLDSTFLSAFWDAMIALLFVALTILDAVFVTVGFAKWCGAVTQRFPSCESGQGILHLSGEDSDVNTENFFIQMGTVQFGIWTLFVSWVLLLVLAGRKLFIFHERENLIISMARDRRRYVSEGYNNLDR